MFRCIRVFEIVKACSWFLATLESIDMVDYDSLCVKSGGETRCPTLLKLR